MNAAHRSFEINKRITVHPLMNKITIGGSDVILEPRIMRLLVVLCSKPGEVMSKATLLETIWESKHINEEGLTKAISVLRKELRDPLLIKTVPKHGYSLVGEVELVPPSGRKRSGASRVPFLTGAGIFIASMTALWLFSVIDADLSERRLLFDYKYMTDTKGLYSSPAISSTDLIAFVAREDVDGWLQLVIKSSETEEILYRSPVEIGDASYPGFSPSSDTIAFTTKKSGQTHLNILSLSERKIRRIHTLGEGAVSHVDWSPDGNFLVFSDRPGESKYHNLFTYNFRTESVAQLTDDEFHEFNPVFSSDGNQVAFLQSHPNYSQRNLSVYSMQSGSVNTLRTLSSRVYDHDWTDDDESLLFTSRDDFGSYIHKLHLATGKESIVSYRDFYQISVYDDKILACNYGSDHNLFMRSLDPEAEAPKPIVNSSRQEWLGVLSPDNSLMAFISDRSGSFQLWQYNFKSKKAKQLTSFKDGLLYDEISWSPDGRSILAGIRDGSRTKIVRIFHETLELEVLLEDDHISRFPCYVSVNQFHFISDRSGKKELWMYDIGKGKATKRSYLQQEVDFARVGEDGMIYYSKSTADGIWRSSLRGENTTLLIANDRSDYANWELVGNAIYHIDRSENPPKISMFDIKNGTHKAVQELLTGNRSWYARFSVSADQSKLIYNQSDYYKSDIVLLAGK